MIKKMSWLNTIVEEILNEIGADDAYNRFYNSIPKEDYDEILGGDTNIDKFMQFILNGVRDGLCDKNDAIEAVQAYKNADPLIRQAILNNFRNGEYESAIDVYGDIKYLSEGGGVINKNKFAKSGYIKVGENDDWLVTCTTNYLASNHYFGMTHWCTASDREGDYDGYQMFQNYALSHVALLIQYSNKENSKQKYQIQWYGPSSDKASYNVGQVCDFADNSCYIREVEQQVNDPELMNILNDKRIFNELLRIQKEQTEPEAKYQEKQTSIIRKKRERKRELRRILIQQLQNEVDERNRVHEKKVNTIWHEFLSKQFYNDLDFISYLFERDCASTKYVENEEEAEKTHYAAINSIQMLSDTVCCLTIGKIEGEVWYVQSGYDDDNERPKLEKDFSTTYNGSVYVIVKVENSNQYNRHDNSKIKVLEILKTGVASNDRTYVRHINNTQFSMIEDFNGEDVIYDTEKNIIYSYRKHEPDSNDFLEFDNCYICRNGDTFFVSGTRDFRQSRNEAFVNIVEIRSNGEYQYNEFEESKEVIEEYGFLFLKKENRLIHNDRGVIGEIDIKVSLSDTDSVVSVRPIGFDEDFPYRKYIRFVKYGGEANVVAIFNEDKVVNKYLFGLNGWEASKEGNRVSLKTKDFEILFVTDEDKYYVRKHGEKEWKPCDKMGRTKEEIEQERTIRANVDKWNTEGGYSPETKAEMDRMYANHGLKDINADKAFKDWNDDDRNLDTGMGRVRPFNTSIKFLDSLQDTPEPNDNWRGYAALKDPEGHRKGMERYMASPNRSPYDLDKDAPDYVRRNPWYRVGKDGKPIDQPWYTEDEIPARLSDRIQKEQRLRESYDKMKTLMDKVTLDSHD